jgi:gluconate kinase
MLLFSNYVNATSIECEYRKEMRKNLYIPWLTVKMDFRGLRRKATQIMIVQIDMEEPVIQNMNRVMKIYFEGDFANSQAFYSTKLILCTKAMDQ